MSKSVQKSFYLNYCTDLKVADYLRITTYILQLHLKLMQMFLPCWDFCSSSSHIGLHCIPSSSLSSQYHSTCQGISPGMAVSPPTILWSVFSWVVTLGSVAYPQDDISVFVFGVSVTLLTCRLPITASESRESLLGFESVMGWFR